MDLKILSSLCAVIWEREIQEAGEKERKREKASWEFVKKSLEYANFWVVKFGVLK